MQISMTRDASNLDLSTIAALQQKRTLAFVNHFIVTTVQFLNNFSKKCEQKLMNFERKLEKIEAAMVLLEARLSSIPEVNTAQEVQKPDEIKSKIENDETLIQVEPKCEDSNETSENVATPSYPEYDRFIKMVQVGVPLQAVKLKVSIEGLDPNIFNQIMNN